MSDCLFCKIVSKKIPSQIVFEDEQVLAFKDIAPKAPSHIVLIPKKHIATMNDVKNEDRETLGHLLLKVPEIARSSGVEKSGYRLVSNCHKDAGQSVFHIHFHILGGRTLSWPPG